MMERANARIIEICGSGDSDGHCPSYFVAPAHAFILAVRNIKSHKLDLKTGNWEPRTLIYIKEYSILRGW